jgi:hypothetical protein
MGGVVRTSHHWTVSRRRPEAEEADANGTATVRSAARTTAFHLMAGEMQEREGMCDGLNLVLSTCVHRKIRCSAEHRRSRQLQGDLAGQTTSISGKGGRVGGRADATSGVERQAPCSKYQNEEAAEEERQCKRERKREMSSTWV